MPRSWPGPGAREMNQNRAEKAAPSGEETDYLMSIPGMAESIREGLATPLEECAEELHW